jgi:MFS family permease
MKATTTLDSSESHAPKGRKKNLGILFLVTLLDLIGFGMILPLIPYLGRATESSPVMVGLLMSIYSIMQFLFSPFWGGFSDRLGRKPILLISIFGASISHIAFAFAQGYWALFFTRLFAGLFSANISTAMASAADLSSEKNRTQTMGLIGAAFGLGFVLGPFLGAQGAALGPHFGFNDQFASLLAGLLSALNFVFCLFFFSESLKDKSQRVSINLKRLNPFSSFYSLSPKLKASVGLFFAASFALALIEVVLFFVVQDQYDWSYKEASYGFAGVGLVMAFTQGGLIRPLKKRFSELSLIYSGGLIFTFGLMCAYIFNELYLFGFSILFFSLGYAIVNPSLSGFISLQAEASEQGSSFGVTHGFSALSRIFGPLLGTFLLGEAGLKSPFFAASLVIGLALLAFIFFFKGTKS